MKKALITGITGQDGDVLETCADIEDLWEKKA